MSILVTGHKGFIGSNLCRRLQNESIPFTGVDKEDFGILDSANLFMNDVDYVIHLAAVSSVPMCEDYRFDADSVNVRGTLNVLMAAKHFGVKKVILASSAAVYYPQTMYAVTKINAENYCKLFAESYGLPCTILRFFNVYGYLPNSSAVIPNMIRKVLANESPIITGTGEQTRDFIHIDDVVSAILLSLKESPQTYDIGTGEETSINKLAGMISRMAIGKELLSVHTNARVNDVEKSKADKPDWFRPLYTLEEGLMDTIGKMRGHQ